MLHPRRVLAVQLTWPTTKSIKQLPCDANNNFVTPQNHRLLFRTRACHST